uniref:Putative secreted protein n=1 Tax=Ixodes ricinus TaxID=34613 RepID=A0A6B0U2X3_IXORI
MRKFTLCVILGPVTKGFRCPTTCHVERRCGPEVCWAPSWNTHFCLFCFQFRRRLTEKECSTKSSSSPSLSMNCVFQQQQQEK